MRVRIKRVREEINKDQQENRQSETKTKESEKMNLNSYDMYLRTNLWKEVVENYWKTNQSKKCEVCGTKTTKADILCHRNWSSMGAEEPKDLVPLCGRCVGLVRKVYDSRPAWQEKGLGKSISFAKSYLQPKKKRKGKRVIQEDLPDPARKTNMRIETGRARQQLKSNSKRIG